MKRRHQWLLLLCVSTVTMTLVTLWLFSFRQSVRSLGDRDLGLDAFADIQPHVLQIVNALEQMRSIVSTATSSTPADVRQ